MPRLSRSAMLSARLFSRGFGVTLMTAGALSYVLSYLVVTFSSYGMQPWAVVLIGIGMAFASWHSDRSLLLWGIGLAGIAAPILWLRALCSVVGVAVLVLWAVEKRTKSKARTKDASRRPLFLKPEWRIN